MSVGENIALFDRLFVDAILWWGARMIPRQMQGIGSYFYSWLQKWSCRQWAHYTEMSASDFLCCACPVFCTDIKMTHFTLCSIMASLMWVTPVVSVEVSLVLDEPRQTSTSSWLAMTLDTAPGSSTSPWYLGYLFWCIALFNRSAKHSLWMSCSNRLLPGQESARQKFCNCERAL